MPISDTKSAVKTKHRTATSLAHPLEKYYQFQSKIYDLTRWSFLFGRQKVINKLPFEQSTSLRILEVGCGTGRNLVQLAKRYPNAQITGVDLSADMLKIAQKKTAPFANRVNIVHGAFGQTPLAKEFDLVLFSYCLTMVNPGWDELIEEAKQHLRPKGYLALADFHDSNFAFFQRHMAGHHVRMEGHILPKLKKDFSTAYQKIGNAYGGIWQWAVFIGQKV